MSSDKKNQRSPSRERLAELNKEQQYLSSAFKIDNFYKNERLDINELKTKIKEIRYQKEGHSKEFSYSISHQHESYKDKNKMAPVSRQIKRSRYRNNSVFEEEKKTISGFSTYRDTYYNPESRLTTGIPKIGSIGRRQGLKQTKKPRHHHMANIHSSRLQPINQKSKKIELRSSKQLQQFEESISFIWKLYEQLAQITRVVSETKEWQKSEEFIGLVSEYKGKVCSSRFEFMVEIMRKCLIARQSRVILHSRLLQNLSVIYLFVEIAERIFNSTQHKPYYNIQSSHLVNFVGICSNNLLLLLRLIILIYHSNLQLKPQIIEILTAIAKFEKQSYQSQLCQIKDVLLRMEHNNQLINIIQTKLNQRLNKDFQQVINKFLKNVDRLRQEPEQEDTQSVVSRLKNTQNFKPLYEFGYYIFEYLAYHIHRENYIGLFSPAVETAPEPYLPLKHEFTMIINPMKVFLHQKKKIFVRAFSDKFLHDLSQKCNIVFWVQQIPREADPYIDLIPNSSHYKKLYRHHCMYVQMGKQVRLIKFAARVGCEKGKYLIFDGDSEHYPEQESQCLVPLGWKGEAEDKKLLNVLDLILPFLREGTDLHKGMNLLKPKLEEVLRRKKKMKIN